MVVKSTNRSRNDSDLCLRLPHNPEVVGSSPAPATTKTPLSSRKAVIFFFLCSFCIREIKEMREAFGWLYISGAFPRRNYYAFYIPGYDLLRTKAVLSSVRGTSAWRTYGASTAQIRLGYGSDKKVSVKRLTLIIICIFAIDYGVTRHFRGGW